ncbi:hypothetical protein SAMN06272735_2695 [Streptomyces sp. TLI_55]|uniref:hypothetical protein n=1 Tax=Streptomyces sp. TLI_55 TaxID=1938861 RepID=UPI000BCA610C|nr:hypothetical protein [Streptomyces sp. TLI_55]SNX58209.1 hypothetical protein SAMN06272735_2695 [Streptomyces sp. TLI_55]
MARFRAWGVDERRTAHAGLVFRVLALVVLAAGFLGLCSTLFPTRAGVPELLRDLRSGNVSVVQVISPDVGEVRVFWSTGYLGDHTFTYHDVVSLPGAEAERFTAGIKRQLGEQAAGVTFEESDRFDALGFLDVLIPLMYWFVMPHLAWPVALCCVVALVSMVLRQDLRAPSAGYWLLTSVVFGFGFPAYLWSEPRPLWSRRTPAPGGRPLMTGLRVAGATACWAGVGVAAMMAVALGRQ